MTDREKLEQAELKIAELKLVLDALPIYAKDPVAPWFEQTYEATKIQSPITILINRLSSLLLDLLYECSFHPGFQEKDCFKNAQAFFGNYRDHEYVAGILNSEWKKPVNWYP